jgi:hypothetical protein
MSVAIDPKNLHINLLFASGSVPIPRSHPAYSGGPSPSPTRRLDARLLPVTLATIAGLLLIAAFSGGAAHYMLRIAESQSEVPSAIAAGIPDPPVAAPAPQRPAPASVPAMAEPEPPLAAEIVAALPSDAVQVPLLRRPAKRSVKTPRLLSLARRQKPATVPDGENLALAPIDEIPPVPMLPREPILPTPKADR